MPQPTDNNPFQSSSKKLKKPSIFGAPSVSTASSSVSSIFNGKNSPTSSSSGNIFNKNKIKKKKKFKPTIYSKDGAIIQGGKEFKDLDTLMKENGEVKDDSSKPETDIGKIEGTENLVKHVTDFNEVSSGSSQPSSSQSKGLVDEGDRLLEKNVSNHLSSKSDIKDRKLSLNESHKPESKKLVIASGHSRQDEKPTAKDLKFKGTSVNSFKKDQPDNSDKENISKNIIKKHIKLSKPIENNLNDDKKLSSSETDSEIKSSFSKVRILDYDSISTSERKEKIPDRFDGDSKSGTQIKSEPTTSETINMSEGELDKKIPTNNRSSEKTAAKQESYAESLADAKSDTENELQEKPKMPQTETNESESNSQISAVPIMDVRAGGVPEPGPSSQSHNSNDSSNLKPSKSLSEVSDKTDKSNKERKNSFIDKDSVKSVIKNLDSTYKPHEHRHLHKSSSHVKSDDPKSDKVKEFIENAKIENKPARVTEENKGELGKPFVVQDKNINTDFENDSEVETDIADSPPRPRRGRLIRKKEYDDSKSSSKHRRTNSDEDTDEEETYIKYKKRRNNSRHTSTSRSASPNQSKSSSRKPSRIGRDANGRTKLQKLCEKGKYKEAKNMVEDGFDVNHCDYAGNTALHEAALKGHTAIVDLLIENGAIVDKQSGPDDLDTPLIDAAANGHIEVVKLLLKRGADPRISNASGDTAIDSLDDEDPNSSEIRKLLREAAIKLRDQKPDDHLSTGIEAVGSSDDESDGDGHHKKHTKHSSSRRTQQTRNDLLWMDFTTRTGRERIYRKAAEGDVEFVGNYLMKSGLPDIDPFILAARNGHTDVVSLMLAFGAEINRKNSEGLTALSQSIGRGHLSTVKLLLESGADPLKRDVNGDSILEIAKNSINYDEEEIKLIEEFVQSRRKSENNKKRKNGSEEPEIKDKQRKLKRVVTDNEDEKPRIKREGSSTPREEKKVELSKSKSQERGKSRDKIKSRERSKSRTRESSISKETITKEEHGSPLTRQPSNNFGELLIPKDDNEIQSPALTTPVVSLPALSPEEERIQKLKDLETREAYERKKILKKKLNSQKMLNDLSEQAKRKEEERKKAKLLEQDRLKKEKEKAVIEEKAAAEKAKYNSIKHEIDERKRIRENYPYGLQVAKFNTKLNETELLSYCPFYFAVFDDSKFYVDLQIILMTANEKFYQSYPTLTKIPITSEQKSILWNVFFPIIGFNKNINYSHQAFNELYESGETKFLSLDLNWINSNEVEELVKKDYDSVFKLVTEVNSTEIDIRNFTKPEKPVLKLPDFKANGDQKKTNFNIPLRFRNRQSVLNNIKTKNENFW